MHSTGIVGTSNFWKYWYNNYKHFFWTFSGTIFWIQFFDQKFYLRDIVWEERIHFWCTTTCSWTDAFFEKNCFYQFEFFNVHFYKVWKALLVRTSITLQRIKNFVTVENYKRRFFLEILILKNWIYYFEKCLTSSEMKMFLLVEFFLANLSCSSLMNFEPSKLKIHFVSN